MNEKAKLNKPLDPTSLPKEEKIGCIYNMLVSVYEFKSLVERVENSFEIFEK